MAFSTGYYLPYEPIIMCESIRAILLSDEFIFKFYVNRSKSRRALIHRVTTTTLSVDVKIRILSFSYDNSLLRTLDLFHLFRINKIVIFTMFTQKGSSEAPNATHISQNRQRLGQPPSLSNVFAFGVQSSYVCTLSFSVVFFLPQSL